ncbi:uncharacterized protein EV154DRAFT_498989 [Mucor mucedo]|uniref:uncharacterized protein n=1 Tax=Mucor mucedo TaxID=29922 RepID=UPI00221F6BF2|nr:uncharacterized protein EV154DRAFT_498989 [Mucor mucedo]KAI7894239.1 hypothetical protein EV154DRAFT_498989 [Mucor mucedo]
MATIIAASLTNKNLFGNYVANHIFVTGDPFNLSYGSKIHTTYSMLLQKAIDDAVCFKEKDTMTFVLGESLWQLLELVTHTKPFMYGNFINGTLCQVSSESYALRVKELNTFSYFPFFRIDRYGDIKNILKGDGSYFVFIQKGKPVSTKAFLIQQQEYFMNPDFEFIQLDSSKHAVPKQYDMLDELVAGTEYRICTELDHNKVTGMVVECRQISHNLSIKVSRGCMGHDYNNHDFPFNRSLNIIEPLTLAYI